MKCAPACLAFAALIASAHAPVVAEGPIGTVERGLYVCELPGDAQGAAGLRQPKMDFAIRSASRYASGKSGGTYLRRGDTIVMTSGPRQGESYQIIRESFVREVKDGKPGRLRCVRQGR